MTPPESGRVPVGRAVRLLFLSFLPLGLILCSIPLPGAASETGRYSDSEGPVYLVGAVALEYAREHPQHPPTEELLRVDLALGEASDGYVGPRRGADNVWFHLADLAEGLPVRMYATGLRELNEQLVRELNRRGLIGVYVAPHEDDIDPRSGRDIRGGRAELRLVIYTGRAEGLRTYGTGSHLDVASRANSSRHSAIRSHSPVKAAGIDGRMQGDLLFREKLDRYLAYLNRHPGRRVDVSVTPTRDPGGVYLDYLVAEDRPWTAYAQWGNTGTDATSDNRQRLGFQHTQLTGRDDVLRFDYVTGDFDEVHAALASYERPLPGFARTRARVEGSWSQYDASQFGLPDAFEGKQWQGGVALVTNLYQDNDLFIDVSLGGRYLSIEVDDEIAGTSDDGSYFVPRMGLQVERLRQTATLYGSLELERAMSGSDPEDGALGRVELDDDWMRLVWNGGYRFFLEPLLYGRAWHNPGTPSSSTLAHEISLRTSGQHALGKRLIPQAQAVYGGLYSVRGYPQSVLAADDGALFSAEYRFHLPRSWRPRAPSDLPLLGLFRVAPERVYGRPDWDFVVRAFFDWAHADYSDAVGGEDATTLAGYGLGLELAYKRSFLLRFDYGIAHFAYRDVDRGDREAHIIATVRY